MIKSLDGQQGWVTKPTYRARAWPRVHPQCYGVLCSSPCCSCPGDRSEALQESRLSIMVTSRLTNEGEETPVI